MTAQDEVTIEGQTTEISKYVNSCIPVNIEVQEYIKEPISRAL